MKIGKFNTCLYFGGIMSDLKKAYDILDSINDNDSKEIIYQKTSKAYETSDDCLEALMIMVKCIDDYEEKESLLKNAIVKKNSLFKQSNYLRMIFELIRLYEDCGKFKLAVEYLLTLKIIDVNNDYHVNFHLATAYAFLEDDRIIDLIDENEIKILVPYMIYAYKKSDFKNTYHIAEMINKINPYFFKVLEDTADKDENKDIYLSDALKVLRFNSLLINSCPGFISFIVSKKDIWYN